MTVEQPQPVRRSFSPRLALFLLGLIIFVSASVIVTDALSPRNRHPAPPTPAPVPAKGAGG